MLTFKVLSKLFSHCLPGRARCASERLPSECQSGQARWADQTGTVGQSQAAKEGVGHEIGPADCPRRLQIQRDRWGGVAARGGALLDRKGFRPGAIKAGV